ncbi:MAG TPA: EamA family transporter [Thermoanaerobaculia bacterium]|nr:EamA family transporter [Thermoanaerobaculia bacterium]
MPLTVMLLVLLAALLHAGWNFLVKGLADKQLSMAAVVVGSGIFAAVVLVAAPMPQTPAIPYIAASIVLHVLYQLGLLAAYEAGELSHVYPLARGLAALLVALVSAVVIGETLSPTEVVAITLIGGSLASLSITRQQDGLRNFRAALLACLTAAFIAAYSLMDGHGARAAGTALGYYAWVSIINAVVFLAAMRRVRPAIINDLRGRWRLVVVGGGLSFIAYAIVTWAFTVAPIPLVAALREASIIFALLLGVIVLRERLDLAKVVATSGTVFGIALLRLRR